MGPAKDPLGDSQAMGTNRSRRDTFHSTAAPGISCPSLGPHRPFPGNFSEPPRPHHPRSPSGHPDTPNPCPTNRKSSLGSPVPHHLNTTPTLAPCPHLSVPPHRPPKTNSAVGPIPRQSSLPQCSPSLQCPLAVPMPVSAPFPSVSPPVSLSLTPDCPHPPVLPSRGGHRTPAAPAPRRPLAHRGAGCAASGRPWRRPGGGRGCRWLALPPPSSPRSNEGEAAGGLTAPAPPTPPRPRPPRCPRASPPPTHRCLLLLHSPRCFTYFKSTRSRSGLREKPG